MAHINLSREADAIVVAPASADFIAQLAQGRAAELLPLMCLARPLNRVPLLLGLGAWEAIAHPGPWWSVWWAPTLGTLLVGVPAWLLLGRGLAST